VGDRIREHWSLPAAVACLWGSVGALVLVALAKNDWHLVYPLDDTYIHMAIAKNVARHHVWGVTPYGFSWCTSSPLWTGLVALAYASFGVGDAAPLVLNILIATAFCVLAYLLLRRRGLAERELFVALLLLIFMTSLPSLVLIGMEHTLQVAVVCVFLYFAAERLAGADERAGLALLALAPVVSTSRYEGLFLIAPVVGLFALRRRFKAAALILLAASAPIAALGLWAMAHGWSFLPSSLLLKGNVPGHGSLAAAIHFIAGAAWNLIDAPWVVVLAVLAAAALVRAVKSSGSLWTWPAVALAAWLAMVAADVTLSRTGTRWFSRYDAFMVGSAIFLFACCWHDPCCEQLADLFSAPHPTLMRHIVRLVIVVVIVGRGAETTVLIPGATHIVYSQQYQVARFVKEFYRGQTLAVNDIGLVDYMTDIRVVDVAGLATTSVADAIRAHSFDRRTLYDISKAANIRIAIVYRHLFPSGPPSDWVEVGGWELPKPFGLGSPGFTFYAFGEEQARLLRANLESFAPRLPAHVTATLASASASPAGGGVALASHGDSTPRLAR
jgi:hypothetical protein